MMSIPETAPQNPPPPPLEPPASPDAPAAPDRRRFLSQTAAAALGAAALTLLAGWPSEAQGGVSIADVLNFALNLEYLEAEFYTYATTGAGIASLGIGTGGTGTPGPTAGGKQVVFKDLNLAAIAQQIAYDEQQHVVLLRKVLGASAVAKPAINLNALGIGFGSEVEFLILSRAFEDTGVSAYGGAATLLTASKPILQAAAQILAMEAYHAGNIRLQIAQKSIAVGALDSVDVVPPPAGDLYFFDKGALTVTRTPSQVLSIVYANAAPGTARGGFYPNGVNGTIHTV